MVELVNSNKFYIHAEVWAPYPHPDSEKTVWAKSLILYIYLRSLFAEGHFATVNFPHYAEILVHLKQQLS